MGCKSLLGSCSASFKLLIDPFGEKVLSPLKSKGLSKRFRQHSWGCVSYMVCSFSTMIKLQKWQKSWGVFCALWWDLSLVFYINVVLKSSTISNTFEKVPLTVGNVSNVAPPS